MPNPKYIGITIGPIAKTLMMARKSREIWGSSYIFSDIMRKIINKFEAREFLTPYFDTKSLEQKGQKLGLFPDRAIFKSEIGDFDKIETIKKEIYQDLAKSGRDAGISIESSDLEKYFQIYYCEIESGKEYVETISEIYKILDVLDLERKFADRLEDSGFNIMELFETRKAIKSIFGVAPDYPCIAKIAAWDYESQIKCDDDNDEDPYDSAGIDRQCYKYIAIVQSDGDDMGHTVKEIIGGDNDKLKNFSKKLWSFGRFAEKAINEYGGSPIYIGGDDMLFFAPVMRRDGRTVIGLCERLSKDFNDFMDDEIKKAKAEYKDSMGREVLKYPSLSFGLSITYHKFPLGEALEESRNLLESKAKRHLREIDMDGHKVKKEKNALAFKVMKHSGQTFEAVYGMESAGIGKMLEMLRAFLDVTLEESGVSGNSEKILTSVVYRINELKAVIESFMEDSDSEVDAKIDNLFYNEFNEDIHDKTYMSFLDSARELLKIQLKSSRENSCSFEKALAETHNTLRFIKFLEEKAR